MCVRFCLIFGLISVLVGCGSDAPGDASACHPLRQCGGQCGDCDDGDPTTDDRCLMDWTCAHVPGVVACEGVCGGLTPAHTLTLGDGGLGGLAGITDIAVDGARIYAASEQGITLLETINGTVQWGALTPASAHALALVDGRLWAVSPSATTRFARDDSGRPQPDLDVAFGGLSALAVGDRLLLSGDSGLRLIASDGASVRHDPAPSGRACQAGEHLYVVSGGAISVRAAGDLSLLSQTEALDLVDVSVSPDGKQVYAASFCHHQVRVFDRDAATGALSLRSDAQPAAPLNCQDLLTGGDDEALFDQLERVFPSAVAVSADGSHVFVSTFLDQTAVYDRAADGSLTLVGGLAPRPPTLDFDPLTEDGVEPGDWWEAMRGSARIVVAGETVWASARIPGVLRRIEGGQTTQLLQHGDGGIHSLAGAYNVALAPTGGQLYVAARNHGQVAVFSVATPSGALSQIDGGTIPQEGDYSGALTNVAVTEAGDQVLAVDAEYSAVRVLERAEDGTLVFSSSVALDDCGSNPAFPVVVRPVGSHAYVGDFQFDGISCLRLLTREGQTWEEGPVITDPLVGGVESIVATADGRHLYTAAHVAGAVTRWVRDPETGTLSDPAAAVRTDLSGAEFVVVTPDERFVYATSPEKDSLVAFARDPGDGTLSYLATLDDETGLPLHDAAGMAVTPDSTTLFVAARVSDAVSAWSIGTDGRLELVGTTPETTAFDWSNGLAMHPDGHLLLGAAVRASAVWSLHVP
ncbi:MAG: 6-phosphogluconolactonase (cycloisomerase 2 family) [Myxococcota bacterium]